MATDLEALSGTQRKILREAIQAGYPTKSQLNIFLEEELGRPPLANFAGGSTYDERAFDLVRNAQAAGWTTMLVAKLQELRPQNALVRNLPDALRLCGGEARPRRTGGPSLESIVRGAGFLNLSAWAERLSGIAQATCRIEYPVGDKTGYGTGLLVGDDLVLTNYHVIENHLPSGATAAKLEASAIRCRFDHAQDARGLKPGRVVGLADGAAWIAAYCPYDAADLSGQGVAASDHLDFALLRLAEPAGQQEVGGGARRGTIPVNRQAPVPGASAPVFIVQHPEGGPMAMSIGIVEEDAGAGDARLRYDADTAPGSSGSGVFDQMLDLVALHHSGDPASRIRALYNQGIPIIKIVAKLTADGFAPFWR